MKLLLNIALIVISFNLIGQNNLHKKADSLNKIGDSLYWEEKYITAENFYKDALSTLGDNDSTKIKVDILLNIGIVNDLIGNYSVSSNYLMNALDLSESLNYKEGISNSLNNIGSLNFNYNNYETALDYFEISLAYDIELNDSLGIASSYENIGVVHKNLGDVNEALKMYLLAEEVYIDLGASLSRAGLYSNISSLYDHQKLYQESLEYALQANEIAQKENSKRLMSIAQNNIGTAYKNLGDLEKAEEYLLASLTISQSINYTEQTLFSFEQMADLSARRQEYEKAIGFNKALIQLKDSVFTAEKHKQLADLQSKYDANKRELVISQQDKLIQKNRSFLKYTIIALSIFILLSILVIYLYFKKNEAFKKLVGHNIEQVKKEEKLEQLKKVEKKVIEEDTTNNSSAEDDKRSDLLEKIVHSMEDDKLYLDKELTISKLAEHLNSNRKYISEAINQEFDKNFNNYVNEYRVKEARKLILNDQMKKYTLQSISETVGFNNRATFNAAFKKITGVTPSFFYKNIQNKKTLEA